MTKKHLMLAMRKFDALLICLIGIIMVGCTAPQTIISPYADLTKYKYVTVTDPGNSHGFSDLMEAHVTIYDALENSRLEIVGERVLDELSKEQKEQLLVVRYGVNSNEAESVATVNFLDYFTGRPLVSCKGSYAWGWNVQGDVNGAFKNAAQQILNTFPKPGYVPPKEDYEEW